jgi:hypothetical protein
LLSFEVSDESEIAKKADSYIVSNYKPKIMKFSKGEEEQLNFFLKKV